MGLTGITSSTAQTPSNTTVPHDIVIDGWDFDGVFMGLVGGGNLQYSNSTSHRYSDYQDGTPGTVTCSAAPASGATSCTLSSSVYPTGWPYPTGSYALAFPLSGATTTAASGTGSTATLTFSAGATIPVGTEVTISGVVPSGYNGQAKVTASSAGSISYASTAIGAQTTAGRHRPNGCRPHDGGSVDHGYV